MIAIVGIAAPTASASPTLAGSSEAALCVEIDESGEVDADIPACKRFVENITKPAN